MEQYHQLIKSILTNKYSGYKQNRTGIDTISYFGPQTEYDLSEGFPLMTTKKLFFRGVVEELLWFFRGEDNIKSLQEKDVHIWDEWAREDGGVGPIYPVQWRKWKTPYETEGTDQIAQVTDKLKNDPNSRRIILSAWNIADLKKMVLPPCHLIAQFNVMKENVDCKLFQRSADTALGVSFNIASYALMTYIFAQQTGRKPGRLIHTFGDAHIYCGKGRRGSFYEKNIDKLKKMISEANKPEDYLEIKEWIEKMAPKDEYEDVRKKDGHIIGKAGYDHIPGLLKQITREPLPLPRIKIAEKTLEELAYEDFTLINYQYYPAIYFRIVE